MRDFVVNGECLIRVRGNSTTIMSSVRDLGLAEKDVRVIPRFAHREVNVDDWGPDTPAEILWMLAEVTIRMVLVHYDADVVDACIAESMGGGTFGTMVGAGVPLGGGVPAFQPGNHYVSVNLHSPVLGRPWRFPTCYLTREPVEIPLGTERTKLVMTWRAIPYAAYASPNQELKSTGVVLFDRTIDI